MKLYIVTCGDYSEYRIRKVYLDKNKAEQYAKAIAKDYPFINEWETSDDEKETIRPIYYVCAKYTKEGEYDKHIDIEIDQTNTAEDSEEGIRINHVGVSHDKNKIEVMVQTVISENSDEEKIKAKYTKVLYDLMSKIESLIKIEQWTGEMVESWLNENDEEYSKQWVVEEEAASMYDFYAHKKPIEYKVDDEVVALVAVEKEDNGYIPDGTNLYERRVLITGIHKDKRNYLYSGHELERTTIFEGGKKVVQDYFGSNAEIEGDKIYLKLTEHLVETN